MTVLKGTLKLRENTASHRRWVNRSSPIGFYQAEASSPNDAPHGGACSVFLLLLQRSFLVPLASTT